MPELTCGGRLSYSLAGQAVSLAFCVIVALTLLAGQARALPIISRLSEATRNQAKIWDHVTFEAELQRSFSEKPAEVVSVFKISERVVSASPGREPVNLITHKSAIHGWRLHRHERGRDALPLSDGPEATVIKARSVAVVWGFGKRQVFSTAPFPSNGSIAQRSSVSSAIFQHDVDNGQLIQMRRAGIEVRARGQNIGPFALYEGPRREHGNKHAPNGREGDPRVRVSEETSVPTFRGWVTIISAPICMLGSGIWAARSGVWWRIPTTIAIWLATCIGLFWGFGAVSA